MKTKHLDKKLVLSKQTIADLNNITMKNVKGGTLITAYTCVIPTICIEFTCLCTEGDICRTVKNSCFGELCPTRMEDCPIEA